MTIIIIALFVLAFAIGFLCGEATTKETAAWAFAGIFKRFSRELCPACHEKIDQLFGGALK